MQLTRTRRLRKASWRRRRLPGQVERESRENLGCSVALVLRAKLPPSRARAPYREGVRAKRVVALLEKTEPCLPSAEKTVAGTEGGQAPKLACSARRCPAGSSCCRIPGGSTPEAESAEEGAVGPGWWKRELAPLAAARTGPAWGQSAARPLADSPKSLRLARAVV